MEGMKAAVIGYGKMGREIERILRERGHEVGAVFDVDNAGDLDAAHVEDCDVALEFTTPAAAAGNVRRCIDARLPVVCGTTGWGAQFEEVCDYCRWKGGTLFYASNYCLGVNLLFRLNRQLAELMRPLGQYDVRIEETHHIHKKDAPSGTAITLAEGILECVGRKDRWVNRPAETPGELAVTSVREGEIAGIHTVTWESADDLLVLSHTIKNRRTLAEGAVVAAEYLAAKGPGIYTMEDLLNKR